MPGDSTGSVGAAAGLAGTGAPGSTEPTPTLALAGRTSAAGAARGSSASAIPAPAARNEQNATDLASVRRQWRAVRMDGRIGPVSAVVSNDRALPCDRLTERDRRHMPRRQR
jgi:hypothetical protein